MEKGYRNTGYFMLLLLVLAFVGFYKSYFSYFPSLSEGYGSITKSNVTVFHHLHALTATVWVFFLIIQPLLIRYGKYRIHKKLGKTSYFIFPLLIASLIPLIIYILGSSHPVRSFNPIADSVSLILFYSLAVYNKKNTPKHMRYMIGTATVFLGPTIARIGGSIIGLQPKASNNFLVFIVVYLILIGLILLDKNNGKNFRPYVLIACVWIIRQLFFNLLM